MMLDDISAKLPPIGVNVQSTRITTFHPKAPASRMAHARQPLLRRLINAFQPFSAQIARTKISISDPNCRLRDSECIFLDALSNAAASVPSLSPEPTLLPKATLDEVGEASMAAEALLSVRLMTGDRGISCSCGCGWKPVIQSMTSTLAEALLFRGDEGLTVGRCCAAEDE